MVYFYTGRRVKGEDKEAKTIKFQLSSQAVTFQTIQLVYIQYWIAFCEMNWGARTHYNRTKNC